MESVEEKEFKEKLESNLKEIADIGKVEEFIASNEIEFEYKDITYRVKRPNYSQKTLINQARIKKYFELLKDKTLPSEKDLIETYKTRGIDIDEINTKSELLSKQRNEYLFKLGKAIKENRPQEDLDVFKKEIEKIYNEMQDLAIKKSLYLDISVESQVYIYIYTYMAYLVTEKKSDSNWVKPWGSYDEFTEQDSDLINKIVWHLSVMSRNELSIL